MKATIENNQRINGQREGYWEHHYWDLGNGLNNLVILAKGNYKKSTKVGYWEYYHSNGKLNSKGNYINGEEEGYWELYHNNGVLNYKEYFLY